MSAVAGTNSQGRISGGEVIVDGSVLVPQFALIDTASSGDTILVAGTLGKIIRPIMFWLVCGGATTIYFHDGAGSKLVGTMPFATNGGAAPPVCYTGVMKPCATGQSLVINLGASVQVGGEMQYLLI